MADDSTIGDPFANLSGGDALSSFVESAGLQGIVLSSLDLGAPWCIGEARGAPAVLHFVEEGTTFFREMPGDEPIELGSGDAVMLPRGGPYTLSDEPLHGTHPPRSGPPGGRVRCAVRWGGDGRRTKITCCAYRFLETVSSAPLLSFLPPVILVRRGTASEDIRRTLVDLVQEVNADGLGTAGILSRLAELAFLRVLREHLTDRRAASHDILAGLIDPHVGQALVLIHGSLAEAWTVASLAARVGLSRTGFAELFSSKTGIAPMRYLQMCRIQESARLVATTDLGISEIGQRVGYTDAAAFSRAFRRETGKAAREYRKAFEAQRAADQ